MSDNTSEIRKLALGNAAALTALALGMVGVAALLYSLIDLLVVFFLGIVVAAALQPGHVRLCGLGVPKGLAVPMTNERQRQTYYGAINILTHTVPLQEKPRGEGSHTVAYLQWCQSLYPDKKLLVLWDGASYHRGAEMRTFLAQENAGVAEVEWTVTCLRFALKAPEQTPTEDLWLKGKTFLRKHFASNKTFMAVTQCFSTFLQTLSFDSKKFRWYWPDPHMI